VHLPFHRSNHRSYLILSLRQRCNWSQGEKAWGQADRPTYGSPQTQSKIIIWLSIRPDTGLYFNGTKQVLSDGAWPCARDQSERIWVLLLFFIHMGNAQNALNGWLSKNSKGTRELCWWSTYLYCADCSGSWRKWLTKSTFALGTQISKGKGTKTQEQKLKKWIKTCVSVLLLEQKVQSQS